MASQQGGVTVAEVDSCIRTGLNVEQLQIVDVSGGCGQCH